MLQVSVAVSLFTSSKIWTGMFPACKRQRECDRRVCLWLVSEFANKELPIVTTDRSDEGCDKPRKEAS